MKKWLTNGALLVIVLLLWGWIGLDIGKSVVEQTTSFEPHENMANTLDLEDLKPFEYRYTRRNIFRAPDSNEKYSETKTPRVKPPQIPRRQIDSSLKGILGEKENHTAIVDISGTTHYFSLSDSTHLGVVISIGSDSISFLNNEGVNLSLYLKP
ncbi:MAG: hypothetical protein HQ556_03295 [Candidatus Marinimicrobia bacterium]|nr:hypothetical protein [Candidatus Neomarinimicrobiota bacterium]